MPFSISGAILGQVVYLTIQPTLPSWPLSIQCSYTRVIFSLSELLPSWLIILTLMVNSQVNFITVTFCCHPKIVVTSRFSRVTFVFILVKCIQYIFPKFFPVFTLSDAIVSQMTGLST